MTYFDSKTMGSSTGDPIILSSFDITDGSVWKPIKDFDGYFISRDGQVMGLKGRLLKQSISNKSTWHYFSVPLCKNGKQYRRNVHRLVAEAFVPNPLNLSIVNHKDENKLNNCADNLEWCTAQYNSTYGKNMILARQKVAKDRAKAVEMIKDGKVIAEFDSIREASRATGINRHCISRCCKGTAFIAGGYIWRFKYG